MANHFSILAFRTPWTVWTVWEALYSQQKQDLELTMAQIISSLLQDSGLNWRKQGKTTRPFRYDLNQIPYDYTMEVTNRFKGLDVIEYLKNYGWRFVTLYRRQWPKPSSKKETQEGKVVVWGSFTKLRKEEKWKVGEKGKDKPNWMQNYREYQGEIRKPYSMSNAKTLRKTIEWEWLEISSRKLEISRENVMQEWAQ